MAYFNRYSTLAYWLSQRNAALLKTCNHGRSFERCMDWSGIRSAVGAVVGLCSRWEAGRVLQRACGALGLGDCKVGTGGFYTDQVSPASLFGFFTGNLADWDIHWRIYEDARVYQYPYANMLGNHKVRLIVLCLLGASELRIP